MYSVTLVLPLPQYFIINAVVDVRWLGPDANTEMEMN